MSIYNEKEREVGLFKINFSEEGIRFRCLRKKENERWQWLGLSKFYNGVHYAEIYTLEQAIQKNIDPRKDWRIPLKSEKHYFVPNVYAQKNDWVITEVPGPLEEFWIMQVLWRCDSLKGDLSHIRTATGTYFVDKFGRKTKLFDGTDLKGQYHISTSEAYQVKSNINQKRIKLLVTFIVALIKQYGAFNKEIVMMAYRSAYGNDASWQKVVLIMKSEPIMSEVAKQLADLLKERGASPEFIVDNFVDMAKSEYDKDPKRRERINRLLGLMNNLPTLEDAKQLGDGNAMVKVLFPYAFRRAGGELSIFARYILWALINHLKIIVQLPRFHAKSTVITFLYVMYCILIKKKKYILILSSTGGQAVKFLMRIRVYLQSKKMRTYYGDIGRAVDIKDVNESFEYVEEDGKKRSRVWNFKEIYIEPWGIRIMASSIKSANRGLLSVDDRPDLIIFDDVEDRKNTNTLELRQKLIEDIFEEIIPAGDIDCQFIAVGTICHFGSYLLKLKQSDSWFKIPMERSTDTIENILKLNDLLPSEFPKEYRFNPRSEYFTQDQIGIDGHKYFKGQETPEVALWQGIYDYEYFCDKREEAAAVGVLPSFWQERYNIPKTNESRVFTEFRYVQGLEIKYLFNELILEANVESPFVFPNGRKVCNVLSFIGGDLAVSEATSADWRAFFIGFTDPWGNVYVLPPYRTKEPDPFIIGKWILTKHNKYNFESGTFDGQHFQKWFGRILKHLVVHEKNKDGEKEYSKLKVYQEPRSEQKEQVISGTLAPYITGEKLYFVGNPSEFKETVDELMYLGYWDTDDLADALTYFCSHLKFPAFIDFDFIRPMGQISARSAWYDDIPIERRAWLS